MICLATPESKRKIAKPMIIKKILSGVLIIYHKVLFMPALHVLTGAIYSSRSSSDSSSAILLSVYNSVCGITIVILVGLHQYVARFMNLCMPSSQVPSSRIPSKAVLTAYLLVEILLVLTTSVDAFSEGR
jgi:hypothetical protein